MSASRLLREFRDSGYACEQQRFGQLHRLVAGGRGMNGRAAAPMLARRALRITQAAGAPLYMFTLTAGEILQVADISRVSRDDLGDLIGYQRPEVRQHIQEITDYLDSDQPLFPNPIIIALPSTVRFTCSRGPNVSDGIAASGTLEIPLDGHDGRKPGWIVDGQQRAFALAAAKRQDFPVPVNAFVADSVDMQRDQFLRINNTKPLPRGLVTELLPKISTPLPPRLAVRQIPSALCDLLNSSEDSPFRGLIRRPSASEEQRKKAVVTDTSIVAGPAGEPDLPVGLPVPLPQPQQRRNRLHRHLGRPAAVLDRRPGHLPAGVGQAAVAEPPDARRRDPGHGPADGPRHGLHRRPAARRRQTGAR